MNQEDTSNGQSVQVNFPELIYSGRSLDWRAFYRISYPRETIRNLLLIVMYLHQSDTYGVTYTVCGGWAGE